MPLRISPAASALAAVVVLAAAAVAPPAHAVAVEEGHETTATSWSLAEADTAPRVTSHARSDESPHRGARCERLRLEASAGTTLRIQAPLGPAAVIDELRCAAWVRSSRPDVRIGVRVQLPAYRSRKTGRPVETLVPGTVSRDAGRWELLEVADMPRALARQLPALRLEHGSDGDLAGAVATHVVLDLYAGPGAYDIAIDDLAVRGAVTPARSDSRVIPAAATAAATAAAADATTGPAPGPAPTADPPAGLARGVLEVAGLPFFPRALEHNGEPLAAIAALGFN
ncbi:MAG: hypothetical protein ACKOSQ_11545, partial [Planctomycetaceae bacterium]